MDWLKMPPLAALRAFAAFTEHGNVIAAGQALNVSHAAISQQLRALEAFLDVPLLDRSGRAMELTEEGKLLARAVELGFGAIGTAVQDLGTTTSGRPLHVTCTPTFAAHWLMPRLADFRSNYPGADLMIDPTGELVDPQIGGVDVALRYGLGDWPGLEAEMLLPSSLIVVAAPDLIGSHPVSTPADLLDLPWIEELGTTEASHWFRSRGVQPERLRTRIHLPGNLLLDGARDGQGVAVMVRYFVEADVRAGRLLALFEEDQVGGYFIVSRPGVQRPILRDFVRWLRKQMATEARV
jgi:LysR family glycine cleavage system transcriptional activator